MEVLTTFEVLGDAYLKVKSLDKAAKFTKHLSRLHCAENDENHDS